MASPSPRFLRDFLAPVARCIGMRSWIWLATAVLLVVTPAAARGSDDRTLYRDRCLSDELLAGEAAGGLAWVCLDDEILSHDEQVAAVQRMAQVAPALRDEYVLLLANTYMTSRALRPAIRPVLRQLGLPRATLARIPDEAAVWRWLHRVLARRGLDERDACGFRIDAIDARGALSLVADGSVCPDGPYLVLRVRISRFGWRLLGVVATHT